MRVATFDLDVEGFLASFDRATDRLRTGSIETMKATVDAVRQDAQNFAPVDTGWLRDHIYSEVRVFASSVRGEVGTRDVSYAAVVEFGSAPHEIVAVHTKVLRWQGPTGPVFRKRVHHPGTRPRPFLRGALLRAPQHWRRNAAVHLGRARG